MLRKEARIKYLKKVELKEPIAIVGSSGLRSVGKIAIDYLVRKKKPKLFAELYSSAFPFLYYGPSYLCVPSVHGVKIAKGVAELQKIEFYALEKEDVLITKGYQAHDTVSQYMVADKVTDLFKELHTKKIISLGAQTLEKGIRCCVTDLELLHDVNRYGIEKSRVDRFIGFSGLVVAIGREKGIKGVCLFANTSRSQSNLEYPDFNATKELLEKISEILGIKVDTTSLELEEHEEKKREKEEWWERENLRGYG